MAKLRDFALLAVIAACGSPAPTPQAPSKVPADTAKHQVHRISVSPGVELEVLDFGGTGEPIVLLAGLGNTGHVFDDFAPALTDRHRVIAITRRGFGASGTSEAGHDVPSRVADDLAVLDALKFPRAIFAGHSIAGDELSELAITHADRVSALIYLDASHDHLAVAKMLETAPSVDAPPPPEAMVSLTAFAAWFLRKHGVGMPQGEYLATLDIDPRGGIRGFKGGEKVEGAIMAGTRSFDLAKIKTRSLVFLAVNTSFESLFVDVDAKQAAEAKAWWPTFQAFEAATVADNRTNFHAAHLIELEAHHYVFISNRARVLDEIRTFLK